jgi:FMN reductase
MSARKLVVVTAGLRQPSSTRLLADQIAASVARKGVDLGLEFETHTIEVRDVSRDLVNSLLVGFSAPDLERELEAVASADALVAVTPIFTMSYSGLFKLFFDVIGQDQLIDKPVLIAATGGSARHSMALDHAVRPIFTYLRSVVVPTSVFAAPEDWGGAVATGTLASRVDRAAGELAVEVMRRQPHANGDAFEYFTPFEKLLA